MAWFSAIAGILKPVADVFTAGTKRKQAKESGDNKIRLAQVDGDNSLNLTDAEWEAQSTAKQDSTWKDEYVTIVCTTPYVLIVVGALATAFNEPRILAGAMAGTQQLTNIGIDVGGMTEAVVYAAIGLKLWRGR
jgi:hypothetical protein